MNGTLCLTVLILTSLLSPLSAENLKSNPADILVQVNGVSITDGDLELMMISRRIPEERRAELRRDLLELLVERQLMKAYLQNRRVVPPADAVNLAVEQIHGLIRRSNDDPEKILSKLGFDEKSLREEVALPIAWAVYLQRVVTADSLREYYKQHQHEYDGTQLRASQIFLKLPETATEDEKQKAQQQLEDLKTKITAGEFTFEEAAKKYSQAPSAEKGGDVGFFPYQGKMPQAFTSVAFGVKVGEMSAPFETKFGWHLLKVTDKKPGQLSLEDVRSAVFSKLGQEMWVKVIEKERAAAKIEWKDPATQKPANKTD